MLQISWWSLRNIKKKKKKELFGLKEKTGAIHRFFVYF